LKYHSAEISFENSAIIQRQTTRVSGVLGQKLRYDKCPYSSFFVRSFEDEIFDSTGRRDLNTKYTIFDLRCCECLWCNYECRTTKNILTGTRNHNGIPEFVEKGIRLR